MTCLGVSLQQPERFIHSFCEWPVEVKDLPSGSADELDPAHLPLTATLEVSTEIGKRHGFPSFGFVKARFDGVQRLRVRKDLPRSLPVPRTRLLGPAQPPVDLAG